MGQLETASMTSSVISDKQPSSLSLNLPIKPTELIISLQGCHETADRDAWQSLASKGIVSLSLRLQPQLQKPQHLQLPCTCTGIPLTGPLPSNAGQSKPVLSLKDNLELST